MTTNKLLISNNVACHKVYGSASSVAELSTNHTICDTVIDRPAAAQGFHCEDCEIENGCPANEISVTLLKEEKNVHNHTNSHQYASSYQVIQPTNEAFGVSGTSSVHHLQVYLEMVSYYIRARRNHKWMRTL